MADAKLAVYMPVAGVVKNQPRSILDAKAWSDVLNIRFKEAAVCKMSGWASFNSLKLPERCLYMNTFFKTNNTSWLIFHTPKGIYYYDESEKAAIDITKVDGTGTKIPLSGLANTVSTSETIEDKYLVTNGVDDIFYWDGIIPKARELPGVYDPPTWQANHTYARGDYIKPGNANATGFMYVCSEAGVSGTKEPLYPTSGGVTDNTCRWELAGTIGLEGTDACSCKAKSMLNYNGFLILCHTIEDGTDYPQRIRWSQFGNCTYWKNNEDGSGQAGYADLTDGVDWVQTAKPLGAYVVVYKENSIIIIAYVGGDLIWEKRPTITGKGLIAQHAIVNLGDRHIFIGQDNIYSFDLVQPKAIGDAIAEEFFNQLVPGFAKNIYGFYLIEEKEIWFAFHSKANTRAVSGDSTAPFDKALVLKVDTGAWSIIDMPMTAFGFYTKSDDKTIDDYNQPGDEMDNANWIFDTYNKYQNHPINICGDENGYIYTLTGDSHNGADYEGYCVSKFFDFDRPEIVKRVKRIHFAIKEQGNYNLEVYVGAMNTAEEEPTWYGPYYLNLQNITTPWVDMDITGRYIAVKFRTAHKDEPFEITGYMFEYEERGAF